MYASTFLSLSCVTLCQADELGSAAARQLEVARAEVEVAGRRMSELRSERQKAATAAEGSAKLRLKRTDLESKEEQVGWGSCGWGVLGLHMNASFWDRGGGEKLAFERMASSRGVKPRFKYRVKSVMSVYIVGCYADVSSTDGAHRP